MDPEFYTDNYDELDALRLYSIAEAAREMHIGKAQLYMLIREGKLGTILIEKHRKISHMEIVRFIRNNTVSINQIVNSKDIENCLSGRKERKLKKSETDQFLQKLIGEL